VVAVCWLLLVVSVRVIFSVFSFFVVVCWVVVVGWVGVVVVGGRRFGRGGGVFVLFWLWLYVSVCF